MAGDKKLDRFVANVTLLRLWRDFRRLSDFPTPADTFDGTLQQVIQL